MKKSALLSQAGDDITGVLSRGGFVDWIEGLVEE
jgi:hypothetical protein